MKKISKTIFCGFLFLCLMSACSYAEKRHKQSDSIEKPINLTVYLDLSDRLTRKLTPSQMARDTAIINHLVKAFMDSCVRHKIIKSKDHFKIVFYPIPESEDVALLDGVMELDMSKFKGAEKKKHLKTFSENINLNVSRIYNQALNDKNWIGSDVWGFFSHRKVDDYSMRKGYRNILVILTDGFLFYEPNKQKIDNAYSYILPQTLNDPHSSLIIERKGLHELEVLMLEINPYDPLKHDKHISVINDWFKGMGITKYWVQETDLPSNTKMVIDKFLKM